AGATIHAAVYRMSLALITAALVVVATARAEAEPIFPAGETIRARVGGGNIVTHLTGAPTAQLYAALGGVGAQLGRMNSYGWRSRARNPLPHTSEAAMLESYRQGIPPVMLLE